MRDIQKIQSIPYPRSGGYYIIERIPPRQEDTSVSVQSMIYLPATETGELKPHIVFGDKLKIFGEHLISWWGQQHGSYRMRYDIFTCATWTDGFLVALDYTRDALNKLEAAIETKEG